MSIVGEVAELVPEGASRFIDTQRVAVATFERDAGGQVRTVEIGGVVRVRTD